MVHQTLSEKGTKKGVERSGRRLITKYHPGRHRRMEENHQQPVKIAAVPMKIRTQDFQPYDTEVNNA